MNILSSFTHPHIVPNLFDFLLLCGTWNKCKKSVGTKCCFGPRWVSLDWRKQLKYILQNISVPLKTENSCRFRATWGWVNYCRFFYSGSFGTEQLRGANIKACGLLYLIAVIERRCALANCRSAEAVLIERGEVFVCVCVEMSKRKSKWERELDGSLTGTSRGKQLQQTWFNSSSSYFASLN